MEINLKEIWDKNCLICLQESEYKLISIHDETDNSSISTLNKISKCTDFKDLDFETNPIYPENICRPCYSDLLAAYKLIILSEFSKNKLDIFYKNLLENGHQSKELQNNSNDICKKCEESENKKNGDDTEIDNLILYEEHISSDFEMEDNDNTNNTNNETIDNDDVTYETLPKKKRKTVNTDIFEESKKQALERQNKEKFQKSICDLCGNYYSQNQLKYHRMRHDKVKRFPCEICQKRFATETDLRRHMRVHTGEKPYACQYCDRRFSDYGSRVKHERFHTGERPYECNICHKSFTYSHALKKHQTVHTGFKEFRCRICNSGFTKKEYLANHMKKHSKDEIQNSMNLDLQEPETIEEENSDIYYYDMEKSSESLKDNKLSIKIEN